MNAPRFAFGKNWTSFSETALTPERVDEARRHFQELIPPDDLPGRSFLDIGFGQGLTLCLAREAGAECHGLDVDPDNLRALEATAHHLGFEDTPPAEFASILDEAVIERLAAEGGFDIVHSWGVLHHTGDMWTAIDHAARLVKPGGLLVIALYRRHVTSPAWKFIKLTYNKSPRLVRSLMIGLFHPILYAAKWIVTGGHMRKRKRGMDFRHDVIDWIGGYPYEYAGAGEVRAFIEARGFEQTDFRPAPVPTGCHEFVFRKIT